VVDIRTEGNDSYYVFFANMSNTIEFKGFIGFGIKQLNPLEFQYFCNKSNYTTEDIKEHLNLNDPSNFTMSLSTRVILSGCYYIDPNTGLYSSYGMEVLETTNTSFTQCISYHLTQFAGGWITVPNGINFNDVFARASFLQNLTIYMTVIVMCSLYLVLFIFSAYMDRKDRLRNLIKILPENESDDTYFYEIIFYTGARPFSETDSNVSLFI
jgi:hypothetical protein